MRLIFSKDRPAQLDLLLRSLERYAPEEQTTIIRAWSSHDYRLGYDFVQHEFYRCEWWHDADNFHDNLRGVLAGNHDTVTFFCDDDVVFRPLPSDPRVVLANERVLCHSWRLAGDASNILGENPWDWTSKERTDHGYPGSIDGHTFRTADVLRMIDGQRIDNPTMLETILAHRCEMLAEERPLMSAWPEQVLVSVPVNRVSEQSGCEHGLVHPQTTEELNARWLSGERIALERLDFSEVATCHKEIAFSWEPR